MREERGNEAATREAITAAAVVRTRIASKVKVRIGPPAELVRSSLRRSSGGAYSFLLPSPLSRLPQTRIRGKRERETAARRGERNAVVLKELRFRIRILKKIEREVTMNVE